MAAYTRGIWRVKPGRDKEFIEAWRDLAEWATAEHDPHGWGKLLKDEDAPGQYLSVGEWRDKGVIEAWRQSSGFQMRMAEIRELVVEMDIHTLDLVAEVGRVSSHV